MDGVDAGYCKVMIIGFTAALLLSVIGIIETGYIQYTHFIASVIDGTMIGYYTAKLKGEQRDGK